MWENVNYLSPSHVSDNLDNAVSIYKTMFLNMQRAMGNDGNKAPNKVILMLAVIGYYKMKGPRQIPCNIKKADIQMIFADYWKRYVSPTQGWKQDISTPWELMEKEPFWHVCKDSTKGCYLDESLQKLIIDNTTRKELRSTLLCML